MFIHSNFEKVSYEKHGFSKEINGGNHDGGGYAELQAVNYYHKELQLGCCSSPRSASDMYIYDHFLS